MNDIDTWNIDKSESLYGTQNWGCGYFGINEQGHIKVSPNGPSGPSVDLYEIVQKATNDGLQLPLLFRFNDILRHRIRSIYNAFGDAITEYKYQGKFYPAYPIKVNQQRHIIDVIRKAGDEFSMALEVGSKPELIAILALHDNPRALLLCNGYKDTNYIEMALMSKKVGRRPVIIIEKLSELRLVLEISERLNVEPEIGFRMRLTGKGAGRWERSGGDRAKFGLTLSEILTSLNELKRNNKLDCLKLLHCHIGSQLTSIGSLRLALKELTQTYVQLQKTCPNLNFLDVGGGLAVDYDGSRTTFESSMNYTVEEYARDVVWTISEICKQAKVPEPNIITESGRATVAHHSILVFNVLGIANTFQNPCNPEVILSEQENITIRSMAELLKDLSPKNCHETLHDAMALRTEIIQKYNLGLLSIEERAIGDECFWALLTKICKHSRELNYIPEDLENLPNLLSDTYFCNFSVFQSIPDSWAIQQIFPIMPLHRLNEEPTQPVVLADITCDSDGKIDRFADIKDVKRHLPAHTLKDGEDYYFATFLVGAYQEILGDLHNLFGDTNAVHIDVEADGEVKFSNIVIGDTVTSVLNYVQFDRDDLQNRWQTSLDLSLENGLLTPSEHTQFLAMYTKAFEGYTYLVNES